METMHTPKPWRTKRGKKDRKIIFSGENWESFASAWVRMKHNSEDDPEGIANAKLIAAAPEMLEALLEAEAALHMLGGKKKPPTDFIPCEVAAYRIVSKAIKKATK